jgi:hypothetical protein
MAFRSYCVCSELLRLFGVTASVRSYYSVLDSLSMLKLLLQRTTHLKKEEVEKLFKNLQLFLRIS